MVCSWAIMSLWESVRNVVESCAKNGGSHSVLELALDRSLKGLRGRADGEFEEGENRGVASGECEAMSKMETRKAETNIAEAFCWLISLMLGRISLSAASWW